MDLKGVKIIDKDEKKSNQKFALIIGISDYQYFPKLDFAHSDAVSFYNFLTSKVGGEIDKNNILRLINEEATSEKVMSGLEWLIRISKSSKPGDEIIVYFSGHGGIINSIKWGYLALYNSPAQYNGCNVLNFPILQSYLNILKLSGAHITFIVDACHSGEGMMNNDNIISLGMQLKDPSILVTDKILSCKAGQVSFEDKDIQAGIFTHFLLLGLGGKADGYINSKNKDGKITFQELERYLQDTIKEYFENKDPSKPKQQLPLFEVGDPDNIVSFSFPINNTSGLNNDINNSFLTGLETSAGGINNLKLYYKYKDSTELLEKFNSFNKCIYKNNLIDKNKECALSIFKELENTNISNIYLEEMRYKLLSALQYDGSNIIQSYLDGKNLPKIPSYKNVLDKDEAAMELVDISSPLFKKIKSELLFLKAVGLKDSLPDDVLNLLTESQQLNEDVPYVYNELGVYYLKNKNFEEAEKNFKIAEQIYPNWIYPKLNLAVLYKDTKPTIAASYLYKLIKINENYSPAYYLLGILALNVPDKLENLNKCISLDSNMLDAYYHLALVKIKIKKYPAALEYLNYVEKKDSNFIPKETWWIELEPCKSKTVCVERFLRQKINDNLYFNLGLVNHYIKDYEESILDFTKALRLDSNNVEIYFQRGLSYLDLASNPIDYSKSYKNFDSSSENNSLKQKNTNIEKNEDNSFYRTDSTLPYVYVSVFKSDTTEVELVQPQKIKITHSLKYDENYLQLALNDFGKILILSKNSKDSTNSVLYTGICYLNMCKFDTSIYYFEKINDLKESYYYKGIAYSKKDMYQKAYENFRIYVTLNPNSADGYAFLCKASNKILDYYSTIKFAEEISKNPSKKYSEIYLQQAYAYAKTFEYDSAFKFYDIVSSIDKNNPDLYIYRGITYFEQLDNNGAFEEWDYAKSIAPDRIKEIDFIINNAKRIRSIK